MSVRWLPKGNKELKEGCGNQVPLRKINIVGMAVCFSHLWRPIILGTNGTPADQRLIYLCVFQDMNVMHKIKRFLDALFLKLTEYCQETQHIYV